MANFSGLQIYDVSDRTERRREKIRKFTYIEFKAGYLFTCKNGDLVVNTAGSGNLYYNENVQAVAVT